MTMSLPRRLAVTLALALLAPILFLHCGEPDRMAGTTTSAENTVTGIALLPGGKPAAGAQVHARSGKVGVGRNGEPAPTLLAFTQANGSGAFSLAFTDTGDFYLEIMPAGVPAPGDSFPPVFFKRYAEPGPQGLALGSLQLARSGAFGGRLQPPAGKFPEALWIGLRGSDNFVRAMADPANPGNYPFLMAGVPPGNHQFLVLVQEAPAIGPDIRLKEVDAVAPSSTLPGGTVNLGPVPFSYP